jgi:hypothetical protein
MKHIVLAVACAALLTAPALGDWSEDFQSYSIGSVNGVGGWRGWDAGSTGSAVAADPAAGAPAGNKVIRMAVNDDAVQLHSGYTSGAWVYKAKQYIPSANHGTNNDGSQRNTYFILMNTYAPAAQTPRGWACQLHMDLTHDVVRDSEAADGFVPVIYDQWVEIRVEIDLDANFKTTYYNGTRVGCSPWFRLADTTNQHREIAALDLWADNGGDGVCYDDLSITPGTPVKLGNDITSYPGVAARYLVNLGRAGGHTAYAGIGPGSGLYEFTSSGGNQKDWWHLNDNDPWWDDMMVTFYGGTPDYFGYKFKLPATVTEVIWWNAVFSDGGSFAATPELQYLDGMNGTWHTITGVSWDTPYKSAYGWVGTSPDVTYSWGVRRYKVTLNTPQANCWGIRLYGATQPGANDNGVGANQPGSGFLGVTEMTLYGQVTAGVDFTKNLAISTHDGATAIMSNAQFGAPGKLNDGDLTTYETTSAGDFASILEDIPAYLGVTWTTPQANVASIGVLQRGFHDGGFFKAEGLNVQYTVDGYNWVPVTGLDVRRYPLDEIRLQGNSLANRDQVAAQLFTFDAIPAAITGLRLIGDGDGSGGDSDGFVACYELEVFPRTTN